MANLPLISVITPSYNQGTFIERTIRSVIDQGYQNLEYIVIDGGSTDGSAEIIRKYEKQLAYWISEPDRGQAPAINRGLRRATGDWIAWQNSDDIYFPGVFADVAKISSTHPDADLIIGNMMIIDETDCHLRDIRYVTPNYKALLAEGMVLANQAAFWRRRVHEKIGWIDESYNYSFDYDWFLRLTRNFRAVHVNRFWGGFRLHGDTKTRQSGLRFVEENKRIIADHWMPRWKVNLYRLRRMALLLAQGNVRYVTRGLMNRARGQSGDYI